MTRSSELAQELRVAVPLMQRLLQGGNLARQFDDKVVLLLASLEKLRATSVGPSRNPIMVRSAMSTASSNLKEVQEVYLKVKGRIRPSLMNERQDVRTAFENFDQKADQLFNILATALKSEKELQSGLTRNIL